MKKDTSWQDAAAWYDSYLQEDDTYQASVIWPNLKRLLLPLRGKQVADIACGSGFFATLLAKEGARVSGIDASPALIECAQVNAPKMVEFSVASAEKLPWRTASFQEAIIVSAIENMERPAGVLAEAARILRADGALTIVLNHPAFRIPKKSSWGFDEASKMQYRRLESYLSESKEKMILHPSQKNSPYTIHFHRSLQVYFKILKNCGFLVETVEEWVSHKKSEPGPRAAAENMARREFPLFLCLRARKTAS